MTLYIFGALGWSLKRTYFRGTDGFTGGGGSRMGWRGRRQLAPADLATLVPQCMGA